MAGDANEGPRLGIGTAEGWRTYLASGEPLARVAVQDLDLRPFTAELLTRDLADALFLGCRLEPAALEHAISGRALVFPDIPDLPYRPYRARLYTAGELLGDYRPGVENGYDATLDGRIWAYYRATGGQLPTGILENLSRRLHDLAMTDAMHDFIAGRRRVGIMGGHSLERTDPVYRDVARIGRQLSRKEFLVVTGGGPGAMEAAHLGAYFATRADGELEEALEILARAPAYDPIGPWMDAAWEVGRRYPFREGPGGRGRSLGVPTWVYGHEPPTLFATHVAKFFANSLREDGLVTIADGGLVFAPGKAGTVQEIFQDTTQNYYETLGEVSPMVFFGRRYWTETLPAFPLLEGMARGRKLADYLAISDDPDEIVERLEAFRTAAERT